ncbi:hypothetical protein ACQP2T_22705 [Nonomuraea sp. CA-143628]|uniref:hypothetical protein n=1 Tax=Nonomuraea sp. CA-143628 TaxID=3239997 RepID=UPI003D8DE999
MTAHPRHTQATGQEFTKDALDRAFELTQGQPWLVNALAHEIIFKMAVWRPSADDPQPEGLAQLDRYLDRLTLPTGVLVIFDRRPEASPWKERGGFEQATTPSDRQVTVLRV